MADLDPSQAPPIYAPTSPLQQGAVSPRPQAALSSAQQAAQQALAQQQARFEQGQQMADQGYSQVGQASQGMQGSYQNLKQLLQDTAQRLGNLQYGPSKTEQALNMAAAFARTPQGLQGPAASGGAATQAYTQGLQQQREGELMKQQLMAKYGIDAAQAGQMADQMKLQQANAMVQRGQQQQNSASTNINSALQREMTGAMNHSRMNQQPVQVNVSGQPAPNQALIDEQAAAAKAKAAATLQGQMGALGGAPGQAPAAQGGDAPGAAPAPKIDPTVAAIASYQVPMPPINTRTPIGVLQSKQLLNQVLAVNPDFQQGNYANANKVRMAFDTGQQGEKLRFIGNTVGHLDTYDQLQQALQTGNIQGVNALVQKFAAQTGHPEITNAQAVQDFLGAELTKTVVPNAGTGRERQEKEESIKASLSPDQWAGVRDTYKQVLATQLAGLESEYRSSLYFMPKTLTDPEWSAKFKMLPEAGKLLAAHHDQLGSSQYANKEAVIADVKAGKIPYEQGKSILIQNGWAK